MITGFNTDVRHGDVVFHVQTEDKGTGNPCIESLVYVGGQILARKRAGYRSLLDEAEGLKEVAELMERQHRSMIQEIRSGQMDEKVAAIKGAAPAPAASTQAASTGAKPTPAAPTRVEPPADPAPTRAAPPPPGAVRPAAPPVKPVSPTPPRPVPSRARPAAAAPSPPNADAAAPAPLPPPSERPKAEAKTSLASPSREKSVPPAVVRPLPPARPHPPPPVARPPEPKADAGDRSLDQVILDYLEMESDQERLVLTMNRRDGELEPGAEATLLFRAESSIDRDPIGEALITVRLISTVDEPQLLAEGRTDDRGELALKISIPDLQTGTGAVIVNAESSIGKAEARHLI